VSFALTYRDFISFAKPLPDSHQEEQSNSYDYLEHSLEHIHNLFVYF
jgi:catalase